MEALWGKKGKKALGEINTSMTGCWRSEVALPTVELVFLAFSSFLKNKVITMLSTLEEDIKPIVPSLIYIPVHLLGNEFICVLCIFISFRSDAAE